MLCHACLDLNTTRPKNDGTLMRPRRHSSLLIVFECALVHALILDKKLRGKVTAVSTNGYIHSPEQHGQRFEARQRMHSSMHAAVRLTVPEILGLELTSSVPLMTYCHSLTVVCQWYWRMPPGAKYTSAPVNPAKFPGNISQVSQLGLHSWGVCGLKGPCSDKSLPGVQC